MNERGLLDLIIARLPELSFREKILLSESLSAESELIQMSWADIESIIRRKLPDSRGKLAAGKIDSVRRAAMRDAETARLCGINWVTWQSPEYPPLLREIYDPPLLLFFRGKLPNPEIPLAAVVGTRKPSPQAAAQAYEIARDLGLAGIQVVSGLALGIDAMAHRGNIDGGASTAAVLGSGVDVVYPSSNRTLARRILETGGALISEYPPGTGPYKWNFPARNRIISGLSRGVLIVEAPQKSGALITARFTLDQNRELWVASAGMSEEGHHNVFDRRGTVNLAGEGAQVIYSASDILSAWNISGRLPETEEKEEDIAGGKGLASSLARSLGISL